METLSNCENFLVNEDVYFANRRFWNDALDNLSSEVREEWVSTKFANGVDFLDGNPIVSALYKRWGKAIRIIQVARDGSAFPVRVWLDHVDYQSTVITELALVVQPRNDLYNNVMDVLEFFLFQPDVKKISRYVRDFNAVNRRAASLKRSIDAMRSVNPAGVDELLKSTIETIYYRVPKRKRQSV